MGIPGLAHHLRPYGGPTSIAQSKAKADSSYRTPAVIDGPSLAHALLRSGKYKLSKEDLVPRYDYEAIGKAAVSWLNWLRSYGFEMYVRGNRLVVLILIWIDKASTSMAPFQRIRGRHGLAGCKAM
jgi:hypothetical protein